METAIRNALVLTGRISPKDRIEVIEKTGGTSDFVRVGLYAYHGRKKKPFVYWNICVDVARELIRWESSTFYYI